MHVEFTSKHWRRPSLVQKSMEIACIVVVILGTKQLKYYFNFMKMTDIDLFYIKKTLKFYIKI